MRKFLVLGMICAVLLPSASTSADLALVLSVRGYGSQVRPDTGKDAAGLADDLRERQWRVFEAHDATTGAMRQEARRLLAAMRENPDPDRLIIAVSGLVVGTSRDAWLLPDMPGEPDVLNAGGRGISLGALADIAAEAPGQAVFIVHALENPPSLGRGLTPAQGPVDLPQGVTLVNGPADGLRDWVRNSLLAQENTVAEALDALPPGARARGFASRVHSFVEKGDAQAANPMGEMAYWNAARDIGGVAALEAYLKRYPQGVFAAQAREQLAGLRENPIDRARAAEDALGLSRDDRRRIQRDLDLLGFDPRGIDGVFGRGSRAAITAWQTANGRKASGYVDAAQLAILRRQADTRAAELEREARLRREAEERADRQFWSELGRDEASLRRYLERYPDGVFAEEAQTRLDRILADRRNAAETEERAAWDLAKSQNTISGYRDFILRFPNGVFAQEAKKRIAGLESDARNAEANEKLRKAEAQLLPNATARLLVEQVLAARGFKPGTVDGRFTEDTRRAIRRFQRAMGLPATGYVTQRVMVILMLGQRRVD